MSLWQTALLEAPTLCAWAGAGSSPAFLLEGQLPWVPVMPLAGGRWCWWPKP